MTSISELLELLRNGQQKELKFHTAFAPTVIKVAKILMFHVKRCQRLGRKNSVMLEKFLV